MRRKACLLLIIAASLAACCQFGCVDRKDEVLPLSADFEAAPLCGFAPLAVRFTDMSDGNITLWEWDFQNDGTVDAGTRDAVWVYEQEGIYTVTLRIADPRGLDSETRINCITVYGGVIYVDGASGDDSNTGNSWAGALRSIQKGLELAPDYWQVLVADGIYSGNCNRNLDFHGKKIHLKSANGSSGCIIDCQDLGRGFHFHSGENASSILDGFTIRNCYAKLPVVPVERGAAVLCELDSSPTIRNCIIRNNTAASGAGICCYSSDPVIENCTITDNNATWGAGIYCRDSSPCIVNCNITSNQAEHSGGGILCYQDSCPDIVNCVIAGNSVGYIGAGICCSDDCILNITNCAIVNNAASGDYSKGGGVLSDYNCTLKFSNCTIAGNTTPGAYSEGSGICCSRMCSINAVNTVIWGNSTAGSNIQVWVEGPDSQATFEFCCFPAFFISGGSPVWRDNCFNSDPLFVTGPGGSYYLSQLLAGQGADSPCLDAGSDTAANLGLDGKTTRTDAATDAGKADLGYHYDP